MSNDLRVRCSHFLRIDAIEKSGTVRVQVKGAMISHGYCIDGIDKRGDVLFRVALKSEVQREFEAGMTQLESIDNEVQRQMVRSRYRGMRSGDESGKLENWSGFCSSIRTIFPGE